MTHSFVPKLEGILDKQSKIPHSSFAEYLEERLGNPETSKGPDMRVFNKSRHLNDVDYSLVEIPYSPVIQSRAAKAGYDLKANAQSSDENMAATGVILSSIGIKYKGYCAQISRSFLVDPTKVRNTQEASHYSCTQRVNRSRTRITPFYCHFSKKCCPKCTMAPRRISFMLPPLNSSKTRNRN
jgi:nucleosome binding factor SPN SPT16 subunit